MNIKGLEGGVVEFFKNLNRKNVYEGARNVARAIDKDLDERHGLQRSEDIQADIVQMMEDFVKTFNATLKEDWDKRQGRLAVAPPVVPNIVQKKRGRPKKK